MLTDVNWIKCVDNFSIFIKSLNYTPETNIKLCNCASKKKKKKPSS